MYRSSWRERTAVYGLNQNYPGTMRPHLVRIRGPMRLRMVDGVLLVPVGLLVGLLVSTLTAVMLVLWL